MTEPEAQKLVTVLVTAFPTQLSRMSAEQQASMQAIYRRMLGDLGYPEANAAVERLLATSRFMPTIAEIRDAAHTATNGQKRAGGEAWGDVLKAIRRYGYMRSPGTDFAFDDPLVHRCAASMGWSELCSSENATADRARFIDLYDQVSANERQNQIAGALPAISRLRELRSAETTNAATAIGVVVRSLHGGDPS